MAKKNWLYIKRGLSEDPKHREAIGMAVWLFMHMCDAADFEKGMVYDWRDKEIAVDMTLSTNTVREWRKRLVEKGYITCKQKQRGIEIIIHNWINPRNYSGDKINVKQGESVTSPSEIQGEPQVEVEGEPQVNQRPTINKTPLIQPESESPSLKPIAEKPAKPPTPPEVKLFREVTGRFPNKVNYPDVVSIIHAVSKRIGRECTAEDLRPFYAAWCFRDYKKTNLAWLSWAESGTIPPQNGSKPNRMNANLAALQAMDFGD